MKTRKPLERVTYMKSEGIASLNGNTHIHVESMFAGTKKFLIERIEKKEKKENERERKKD